jgi:glycerol kinase
MRYQPEVRAASESGDLQLGLSAAWLLKALGKPTAHQMDTSLVQAMGLYDFQAQQYWQEWIDRIGVTNSALPAAMPTLHEYGALTVTAPGGQKAEVPVCAMIGDQQSALFGHNCRQPGDAECTHGTASFVKVFLDDQALSQENINVYNAWHLGDKQTYCLEAPTTVTGAAIRWMRDNAGIFDTYEEMDELAASVSDVGGLAFVPAFTGLDVPYNNPAARATIFGLTLGHHRGHIARAFFESIGYQLRTILETITKETGVDVKQLVVGGGVSASDLACQVQADLLNMPVARPTFAETTSWAAGLLAGLGAGIWPSLDTLPPLPGSQDFFYPMGENTRHNAGYQRWQHAVSLVCDWSQYSPDPDE